MSGTKLEHRSIDSGWAALGGLHSVPHFVLTAGHTFPSPIFQSGALSVSPSLRVPALVPGDRPPSSKVFESTHNTVWLEYVQNIGTGHQGPYETSTREENGAEWVVSEGFLEEAVLELGSRGREALSR